jgi:hypothetical protein
VNRTGVDWSKEVLERTAQEGVSGGVRRGVIKKIVCMAVIACGLKRLLEKVIK